MCMSVSRQLSSLCPVTSARAACGVASDSQKRQIWYGVCGRRVLRYPARSGDTLYRNRIGIRTPRPTPATPGRTAGLVSAESGAGARTHSHGAWALGRCASGTTLHTLMSKHTHTHPSAVMTSVTSCIAHSSLRPPHATARRQQQAAAPSARRLATATRRSIAGSSMPWLPRHRACSLRVLRALGAPFAPAWQCACRGRRSSRG